MANRAASKNTVAVDEANAKLTDPNKAKEFVTRSGCDSLAVAIGTSHGAFKIERAQALRFDVLAEIQKRFPVPPGHARFQLGP